MTNIADGEDYVDRDLEFTQSAYTLFRNILINSESVYEDLVGNTSRGHNQFMATITSSDPMAPYVEPSQLPDYHYSLANMKIIDQFAWQKFFRPADIAVIIEALAMGLPRPADATNFPFKLVL